MQSTTAAQMILCESFFITILLFRADERTKTHQPDNSYSNYPRIKKKAANFLRFI